MRWKEIISERATRVFYHGTSNEEAAKAILENGINPPDLTTAKNTMLRPVVGRVYVTPHIGYAQIYAIGGAFAGASYLRIPYEGNEERFKSVWGRSERNASRYGYVFVIPETALSGDQQPDEDDVGQLYHYALRGGTGGYADTHNQEVWDKLAANPILIRNFKYVMDTVVTAATRKRLMDGEYAYYARAGKQALKNKRFTPELKKALIDIGCHVAHEGSVIPSECWKLDKAKVGWLEKDGSNFFDIAERIR